MKDHCIHKIQDFNDSILSNTNFLSMKPKSRMSAVIFLDFNQGKLVKLFSLLFKNVTTKYKCMCIYVCVCVCAVYAPFESVRHRHPRHWVHIQKYLSVNIICNRHQLMSNIANHIYIFMLRLNNWVLYILKKFSKYTVYGFSFNISNHVEKRHVQDCNKYFAARARLCNP